MQTVREGDGLSSYWLVAEENGDGTPGDPIDLTGATVEVHARLNDQPTAATIVIPAVVEGDPVEGRISHPYDMLAAGVYFLVAVITRSGVTGTSPTARNALLRVVAKI
jgi:hypothetical protein